MASLTWTDAAGTATLTNGKPAPADRFAGWTPRPGLEADRAHALGDGVLHVFAFGPRYDATFRLEHIPNTAQPLLARLVRHLLGGGVVSVATDDADGRTYPACQLVDGEPPQLELADRALLEWTLTLTVRNVAAPAVAGVGADDAGELLCIYP